MTLRRSIHDSAADRSHSSGRLGFTVRALLGFMVRALLRIMVRALLGIMVRALLGIMVRAHTLTLTLSLFINPIHPSQVPVTYLHSPT